MLDILFFFGFTSSIILFSGIGTDRLFLNSHSTTINLKYYLILLPFTIFLTVTLWALNNYIIIYLKISFLRPILFLLILIGIDELLNYFFHIQFRTHAEKNFSYGIVFFAVYWTSSLFIALTIIITGFLSLFILSCLLSQIKSKIDMGNANISLRIAPLTLISIGFITLGTYSAEISWLKYIFL